MNSWGFAMSSWVAVAISPMGLVFWVASASAAIEQVTVSASPEPVNYADREISIAQFDSSLGALQSITIDLRGTGGFVQGFGHFGEGQRQLASNQMLNLTLETADDRQLLALSQNQQRRVSPPGIKENVAFEYNRVHTLSYPVTMAGSTTLTAERDLMQFTGSGFVDLFLSAKSGLGNHVAMWRSLNDGFWTAGANIGITYNYLPVAVPECSTWLAGGFAFLSVALIGRHRPRRCG
jgi:hypothetical protein